LVKKKGIVLTPKQAHNLVDVSHSQISIKRQCELLSISRSGYYYEPCSESPENLAIMRLMDKQYMKTPFYGVPRMHQIVLWHNYLVNIKRIRRLYRLMGLEAIYPKPKLSVGSKEHIIYPYLLKEYDITAPNQVWSTDITYIPMANGFLYLVAIIDWFSRFVISWRLSNSLDTFFCVEALTEALNYAQPEIFNSDQGVQFTSHEFTSILKLNSIRISMDGRGRVFDNIFIERFWRTLKYEDIYLHAYEDGKTLWEGLKRYFNFYNWERPHQSLGNQVPGKIQKYG
jgi:putative transposase